MADSVEIPDEVKQQMGEVAVVNKTDEHDPFAVLADLNEEITPPVEEAAEEATPASAEVVATPPAITHPPELIERATTLMIPADEVAEMSTAELRRVIKHADRIGQAVSDYHAQAKPKVETETAKPVDELAIFDDPEKYDPNFIAPIKAVLAKILEENRTLRETQEQIKQQAQTATQHTLHSRLMTQAAELDPDLGKKFNLATKDGQGKYQELLAKMGIDHKFNQTLTEKQLLQRAVKAMDLIADKPKEAPAVTAEKKRWSDNALAQGNSRKSGESLESIIRKIKQEDQRKTKRTNGQAAPLPQ